MLNNLKCSSFPHLDSQLDDREQRIRVYKHCQRYRRYQSMVLIAMVLVAGYFVWVATTSDEVDTFIALVRVIPFIALSYCGGSYFGAVEKAHWQWLRENPGSAIRRIKRGPIRFSVRSRKVLAYAFGLGSIGMYGVAVLAAALMMIAGASFWKFVLIVVGIVAGYALRILQGSFLYEATHPVRLVK